MPEVKKSLKEQLEELCRSLQRMTEHMAENRYVLTKYTNRHSYLLIAYVIDVLIMYIYKGGLLLTGVLFAISFLMMVLSYAYMSHTQMTRYKDYRMIRKEAERVVAEIIGIVDWGDFRKQQYYKGTNEKVSKVLKDYSEETQMKMSPGRRKRDICAYVIVYQLVARYICFFVSILCLIKNLWT